MIQKTKPPPRLYHATNLKAVENMKVTGIVGRTRHNYEDALTEVAKRMEVDAHRLRKLVNRRKLLDPWDPGVSFFPTVVQCLQLAKVLAETGGEGWGPTIRQFMKSAARVRGVSVGSSDIQLILRKTLEDLAGVDSVPVVAEFDVTRIDVPLLGGGEDGRSEWYTEKPINAKAMTAIYIQPLAANAPPERICVPELSWQELLAGTARRN